MARHVTTSRDEPCHVIRFKPVLCSGTKGLVINYVDREVGGGATKWENRGSKTFCAPLRRGKTFTRPPFKE